MTNVKEQIEVIDRGIKQLKEAREKLHKANIIALEKRTLFNIKDKKGNFYPVYSGAAILLDPNEHTVSIFDKPQEGEFHFFINGEKGNEEQNFPYETPLTPLQKGRNIISCDCYLQGKLESCHSIVVFLE